MPVAVTSDVQDFKIISPGAKFPILVFRKWISTGEWNVYYEHEGNNLLFYDNIGYSPGEALEKFLKHHFRDFPGEPFIMTIDNGMLSEGTLND